MDRAAPTLESPHTLELRVLEGPQRGARAPLPSGQGCTIAVGQGGPADGVDIVLREPGAEEARLRVSADTPNAMLEVEQGQVQLGEQTLKAGEQALWPQHTPLRMGSTVIAFGNAAIEHWTPPAPGADPAPASAVPKPPARRQRARPEVWLASTGAGLLIACVATLWYAHAAANTEGETTPAAGDSSAVVAALRASDFGALEVTRSADGRPAVRGRVANTTQRDKLQAWLALRAPGTALDVVVDELVARDVTEVFRVNGIAVKAQVAGAGRIEAEAAEPDLVRLKRAVRGLQQLALRNTATPRPPPAPPLPDDPGKRIASLVPGEPAYLVTADGSRYFVGAVLPSGHRVMRIAHGSVTLDFDGQKQTLNF
jgi:type III secretion protein D